MATVQIVNQDVSLLQNRGYAVLDYKSCVYIFLAEELGVSGGHVYFGLTHRNCPFELSLER
jgi:hypothetical protein